MATALGIFRIVLVTLKRTASGSEAHTVSAIGISSCITPTVNVVLLFFVRINLGTVENSFYVTGATLDSINIFLQVEAAYLCVCCLQHEAT
jgi:hypothetical protein